MKITQKYFSSKACPIFFKKRWFINKFCHQIEILISKIIYHLFNGWLTFWHINHMLIWQLNLPTFWFQKSTESPTKLLKVNSGFFVMIFLPYSWHQQFLCSTADWYFLGTALPHSHTHTKSSPLSVPSLRA